MRSLFTVDFTNCFGDKRLEKRGFSWLECLPQKPIPAFEESANVALNRKASIVF